MRLFSTRTMQMVEDGDKHKNKDKRLLMRLLSTTTMQMRVLSTRTMAEDGDKHRNNGRRW